MTQPHPAQASTLVTARARAMATATATAACLLLALAAPAQVQAMAGPANAAGAAESGRSAAKAPPPTAAAATTLDLLPARITAVDLAAGTITLRGQTVPLHAQQLRVLGAGGQVLGPRALRAGQAVRLALEPAVKAGAASATAPAAEPPARRVVLIYIDG
jgi:hypothetical protein